MLDNDEIDSYMKKLNKLHPNFIYVGSLPSDVHVMFTIDEKYDYGFIFNTDIAKKGGMHWVSAFVDNHPKNGHTKSVEYYGSTGCMPIKRIDNYLRHLFGGKGYIYKINTVVHQNYLIQKGRKTMINKYCGFYAIEFIQNRLDNYSFIEATNYVPSDQTEIIKFEKMKTKM